MRLDKTHIIYGATESSSVASLSSKAALLSTLPRGGLAVGWLFDEGAEFKRRERGREEGSEGGREEEEKAINLAESDRASAKTSTLNSLRHPPPRHPNPPKKESSRRCVGPAAGHTFHTVLRFHRPACAESRTGAPPANLLRSFSRQKINEAF